jgi:hypothetical protein
MLNKGLEFFHKKVGVVIFKLCLSLLQGLLESLVKDTEGLQINKDTRRCFTLRNMLRKTFGASLDVTGLAIKPLLFHTAAMRTLPALMAIH